MGEEREETIIGRFVISWIFVVAIITAFLLFFVVDVYAFDFRVDGNVSDDTVELCKDRIKSLPDWAVGGVRLVVFDDKVIINQLGNQVLAYHLPGIIRFHLGCDWNTIYHEFAHQVQWNEGLYQRRHDARFKEIMEMIEDDWQSVLA